MLCPVEAAGLALRLHLLPLVADTFYNVLITEFLVGDHINVGVDEMFQLGTGWHISGILEGRPGHNCLCWRMHCFIAAGRILSGVGVWVSELQACVRETVGDD